MFLFAKTANSFSFPAAREVSSAAIQRRWVAGQLLQQPFVLVCCCSSASLHFSFPLSLSLSTSFFFSSSVLQFSGS